MTTNDPQPSPPNSPQSDTPGNTAQTPLDPRNDSAPNPAGISKILLITTMLAVVIIGALVAWMVFKPKPVATKVYHIGVLSGLDFFAGTTDGFKTKMADLGYVEGKNIVYDIHKSNIDPIAENKSLQKFKADHVDLVFSFPTEASLEAQTALKNANIPLLFANAGLDGSDLVDSLRTPGRNTTGVQYPTADNAVQRLEILHQLLPKAKRIWVPYLEGYPIIPAEMKGLLASAQTLGVTLTEAPVKSPAALAAELATRDKTDTGIDAILIVPEPLTASPDVFAIVSTFAEKHKIPIGGAYLMSGAYGSLFGYTPDAVEVGKQAAVLADKILKGTPAGTIPLASSENQLILNYKLAQQLGIPVGEDILSRAKEVIR